MRLASAATGSRRASRSCCRQRNAIAFLGHVVVAFVRLVVLRFARVYEGWRAPHVTIRCRASSWNNSRLAVIGHYRSPTISTAREIGEANARLSTGFLQNGDLLFCGAKAPAG
jgi:hypothetical protein